MLTSTKSLYYILISVVVAFGLTFMGWGHSLTGASLPWYYYIIKLVLIVIFLFAKIISWMLGAIVYGILAGTKGTYIATKSIEFVSNLLGAYITLWVYDTIIVSLAKAFLGYKFNKHFGKKGGKGGGNYGSEDQISWI